MFTIEIIGHRSLAHNNLKNKLAVTLFKTALNRAVLPLYIRVGCTEIGHMTNGRFFRSYLAIEMY